MKKTAAVQTGGNLSCRRYARLATRQNEGTKLNLSSKLGKNSILIQYARTWGNPGTSSACYIL